MFSPLPNSSNQNGQCVFETYPIFKREIQEEEQTNKRQLIQQRVQKLNAFIRPFSQLRITNFMSNQMNQKMQTLSVIQCLAFQISKLQDNTAKMTSYQRKRDQFLLEREEALQKIAKQQKILENQKQAIASKKENMERMYKQAIDKHVLQREELQKQLRKIQARQKSFEAEFRKKDNQIKFLQDALKRIQQKNHSKTHLFEVVQQFQQKDKEPGNSSHFYEMLALKKFQDALRQISKENNQLKSFLQKLFSQLNSIIQLAKQKLRDLSVEQGLMTVRKLNSQCFSLSLHYFVPKLDEMLENLKLIEKAMGFIKCGVQESPKESQIQSSKRMNILIGNFKQIVKSQNLILNKAISKQYLPRQNEIVKQEKCCHAIENLEFGTMKAMIEEQIGEIESRNKSLGERKQALSDGLLEAQKIKQELMKEKGRLFGLDLL